jgi:hypothetical protein
VPWCLDVVPVFAVACMGGRMGKCYLGVWVPLWPKIGAISLPEGRGGPARNTAAGSTEIGRPESAASFRLRAPPAHPCLRRRVKAAERSAGGAHGPAEPRRGGFGVGGGDRQARTDLSPPP